jgi:hypothetical protein
LGILGTGVGITVSREEMEIYESGKGQKHSEDAEGFKGLHEGDNVLGIVNMGGGGADGHDRGEGDEKQSDGDETIGGKGGFEKGARLQFDLDIAGGFDTCKW